MNGDRTEIVVDVVADGNQLVLRSEVGEIRVSSSHRRKDGIDSALDFAAWYFLPVGMRLDRPVRIMGAGSSRTERNARTLSEIWQSWVPGHFHAIDLRFATSHQSDDPRHHEPGRDLLFFSGGLDATYAALVRIINRRQQDLLTVHGMDYGLGEQRQFDALLRKTSDFAAEVSDTRIIVRSDAYALYDRHRINLGRHHFSHIFALAGAGFFHSGSYRRLCLAADERLDGQFLTFPWGSNSATNPLFDDGTTSIVTEADGATRSEKQQLVFDHAEALRSLSFCWNRSVQPANCGMCQKCLRTKLLFLALRGRVPDIFQDGRIPRNWAHLLRDREQSGFHEVGEIMNVAIRNGNTPALPDFDKTRADVFEFYRRKLKRAAARRDLRRRLQWIVRMKSRGKRFLARLGLGRGGLP